MIRRIEVRNFAVAREVVIQPGEGLTVVTGETGAGKSLVVDAIDFALGGRRGREVVGSGADRATVTIHLEPAKAVPIVIERSIGERWYRERGPLALEIARQSLRVRRARWTLCLSRTRRGRLRPRLAILQRADRHQHERDARRARADAQRERSR